MSSAENSGLFAFGISPDSFDLPHPRIALSIVLVLRQVLVRAFALLRERLYPLAEMTEDQITAELHHVIENDLRRSGIVPGFNRRTFDSVVRQSEVSSFDNGSLAKKPDLCFKLRGDEDRVLSTSNALFAECKPVDRAHPLGKHYCDKGLRRFVVGDYAWAMQDALMIGYVREGRTIRKHLTPSMQQRLAQLLVVELPHPVVSGEDDAVPSCDALHRSLHHRHFRWTSGKGQACDLVVYHSWHCCD